MADGVSRIPLPLPGDALRAVNVYALEDEGGITLIDAGQAVPEARQRLTAGLRELGAELGDIRRLLVTHVHRDHYTQAITLRQQFGTPVSLGLGEAASLRLLRDPSRGSIATQMAVLDLCGAAPLIELLVHERMNTEPLGGVYEDPDDWLDAESRFLGSGRLQAIPTPGHTQGHVAFMESAARLFFAGDHVLPHITPSIGFEPAVAVNPLGDYLASLARVRELPDAMLLPAHGPPAPSVHVRIDELVSHHEVRLRATTGAVESGRHTPYEVAGGLRWTRREREFTELDPFNRMLATTECKAHLDLLASQGQLLRTEDQGVMRYTVTAAIG